MPDAGFERLVNDFPHIIEAYIIGDASKDMVGVDESFLLPYSFWIYEPNQPWDLITKAGLWPIPWCEQRFADMKEVASFLRNDANREVLLGAQKVRLMLLR